MTEATGIRICPYVYAIINCETGSYYIGSRYRNVALGLTPEKDLWHHYKSSSEIVQDQIREFGEDAFIYEVIFAQDNYVPGTNDFTAYWHEQDLIKEHVHDPLCLNVHYFDREKSKSVFCTAGKPKSLEHREKIGAPQRGVPKKPESIEKFRKTMTGRPISEEHKKNIGLSKAGIPHSDEHKRKIGDAHRGRTIPPEVAEKISKTKKGVPRAWTSKGTTGLKWYNDGIRNYQIKPDDPRAAIFKKGRL